MSATVLPPLVSSSTQQTARNGNSVAASVQVSGQVSLESPANLYRIVIPESYSQSEQLRSYVEESIAQLQDMNPSAVVSSMTSAMNVATVSESDRIALGHIQAIAFYYLAEMQQPINKEATYKACCCLTNRVQVFDPQATEMMRVQKINSALNSIRDVFLMAATAPQQHAFRDICLTGNKIAAKANHSGYRGAFALAYKNFLAKQPIGDIDLLSEEALAQSPTVTAITAVDVFTLAMQQQQTTVSQKQNVDVYGR